MGSYLGAGARIAPSAADLYASADVIAKIAPPTQDEIQLLTQGKTLISLFYTSPERLAARVHPVARREPDRHGHGASHLPRPEDGRVVLDGQCGGLSGGH